MADQANPFSDPSFGTTPNTKSNPFSNPEFGKPSGALRRGVADKAIGFASGAVGATKALADVAGAGNVVSNALEDVNKGISDYLSPEAKADQQEQSAIMAGAEGKGVWEGVKAGARAFGVAPVQTAVQGLGSIAPIIAGTALTGGVVPAAAAGAAIGVGMGAGTAKGAIFDEVKKRGIDKGLTEAQATAEADTAQSYGGANTDQIALGGALGAADALTGVSAAASRMARGALRKPVTEAVTNTAERGIVARAGMGMLGEMPLEAVQGGQEQVAANLAAQRAGYQAGTWDNVASNATLEALASAGPGAAFGALDTGVKPAPVAPPPAPPVTPDAVTPPAAQPYTPSPSLTGTNPADLMGSPMGGMMGGGGNADFLTGARNANSSGMGYNPAAGAMTQFPDGSQSFASEVPPVKPSEAMGLNPAAGPMSAAAVTAVDAGVTQEIQLADAAKADQAAYEQATTSQAEQQAAQDTVDKPITTGTLAEAAMSEEDKRAILFSNKTVADGGIQYTGTQDGDILNGMGAPFSTKLGAQRRVRMEGSDWTIAPVFDGFVARRKDAITTDKPAETNTPTASVGGNITTQAEAEKPSNQPLVGESLAPVATENVAAEKPKGGMDYLMSLEADAGQGFKSNDAAIDIIKDATQDMTPAAKAAVTKAINQFTSVQKDGTRLIKPDFYEEVSAKFAYVEYMISDAVKRATNTQAATTQAPAPVTQPAQPGTTGEGAGASQPTQVAPDIKAITAKQIPDMSDAEIAQAVTHYGPDHARTAKLTKEANRRALATKLKGKSPQTTESTNGTQAPETVQAAQEGSKAPAAEVATEFVKVKDIDGKTRYVRQSALDGEKPLLPLFDGKGQRLVGKLIHRENLDPTGEKQAANNAENSNNPHFDVITNKEGGAFATVVAARRALNQRGLQGTHIVAKASDVSAGSDGFVIRKREATEAKPVTPQIAPAAPVAPAEKNGKAEVMRELAKINEQMPEGFEAADGPLGVGLFQNGKLVENVQGLSRVNGYSELLRQANLRAPKTTASTPQSTSPAVQDFIDGKRDDVPTIAEVQAEKPAEPIDPDFEAAKALLAAQKKATGNPTEEAKVRKQLRDLAGKVQDGSKASSALDIAATRLGMGEGKLKGLEFAEPAKAPEAPKVDALSEKEKAAKAKMFNALGKLAALASKNTRMNWTPEEEQQLLPIVIELFDGAMDLGSVTFQKAVRYVREFISANLDKETADAIPFETLQGAYIHTARKFKDQGATPGKEVMSFDSLEELEKSGEQADAPANKQTLAASLFDAIQASNMPKDNPALKKLVEAFDGKPADPARMKAAQEQLETAIVMTARAVVAKNEGDKTTFDVLERLYNSQPNLNIRTSTSIANQAYSTPAPLAFIASRLAGITGKSSVLEPTAGNGMLVIGANIENTSTNEINDERIASLKSQGFSPSQNDATEGFADLVPQDAIVTNPPFGSVKGADGKPIKVKVDGYDIGQIDHLIAARALEKMKDDGQAVLIIGANKVAGGLNTDDRIFFNWLYGHYNVVGHFEVDGDLYTRQGAAWPVRVIAINGRNKSNTFSPLAGTVKRVNNWSEVYEQYQTILAASRQPVRASSPGPVRAGGSKAGPRGVSVAADTKNTAVDRPVATGIPGGTGDVSGAGAGVVPNSTKPAADSVVTGTDEQRLHAQPDGARGLESSGPASSGAAGRQPAKPTGTTALSKPNTGNEFQAPYIPRSSRKDEGVLIPTNMAQPTQDALSTLEDEVGDIDEFARKELGYASTDDLHTALMGLQVDSVATAIHQIKKGKAVVIADQTGIGKGRQAAAIIRWTVKQGYTPVFISVKPSLFTDMYGDLADIGTDDVQPFVLNGDAWVAGADGGKLFSNKPATHKRRMEAIEASGQLPDGSNAVFMTYSQINKDNLQRRVLMSLAPNAVFILDESHNAAGASSTGEFVIGALELAKGVTYLSATYAKRPDNMPLYFKTDIGNAAADTDGLAQAMAAGGLPLQTVVSNNLVKAGQMFRRERSYDGVQISSVFDTKNRDLHEQLSNEATKALRALVSADKSFHSVYVKTLGKALAAQGESVQDSAGNQAAAGVQHTEFSSVVHNFVKQMLLGLKAQSAADEAIASLKRGEKPIIAVESTMGSFLNEYATSNNIAQGEELGAFDYRTVLSRALERSRAIIIKDAQGNETKRKVPLSELDVITTRAYQSAQAVIDGLKLSIPVSPIDWMRAQIIKAGYSVAEITGRNLSVDYSNPAKPILSAIDQLEQSDKVNTTRQFNGGKLDALILNVAGSTGISLHASEKFSDQRQRHMIVAQAAGDINIFMQMLGRIHRTGQVALPKYTILSVDLPTEKRPTAVLSIKMKSLNANTSSNTESATSVKTSDILNKYGDQIVSQYLMDNYALAVALDVQDLIGGEEAQDDIARKVTGRLALQPIEVQHAFYDEVEGQYNALIEYLNKTNQNDLEPRTFDFDAKETRQEVLFEGPDKTTPFGEDAIYGEYSIKAQGIAMKPEEIREAMKTALDGKESAAHVNGLVNDLLTTWTAQVNANRAKNGLVPGAFDAEKYGAFMAGLYGKDAAAGFVERATKQISSGQEVQDITADAMANTQGTSEGMEFMREHAIGKTFRIDINSEPYNAVITNIRSTHKTTGSPFSLSKVQLTVSVNGALRSLTIPGTQFKKIVVSAIQGGFRIEQLFKEQPANQRETSKIITGNLLAAYGEIEGARGTIISFTKQDGTTEQGILLPKLFDYSKNTRGDYRLSDGAMALRFLQQSENKDIGRFGITSRDGNVRVLPSGQGVRVQVPKSKAKGGKFFLDQALIEAGGDFVSSGNYMVSTVYDPQPAVAMLDLLMKKQALYALPSMAEEAKAMADTVAFSRAKNRPTFSRGAQAQASQSVQKLVDALRANWDNAPEIIVAFDMQDASIPEAVRKEDLKQRSGGAAGTPEGFYYKGKVYLMSSQLATPNDVARVLFHETLGHFGLRGHFGKGLKPILNQIITFRKALVDAKIKEYGLRSVNNLDRLAAAEEVLAEMAQTKPEIGFVKRAVAIIRSWLRANVPGFSNMKMTDAEIITNFILPARRFVEGGGPKGGRGNNTPMFSFAGKNSSTADTAKLATAQARLDNGGNAEDVRKETGWFKGSDGKMRFEINDADAKLTMENLSWGESTDLERGDSTGLPLGRLLDHPALFAAYPSLKDEIWVRLIPRMQGASFEPTSKTIEIGYDKETKQANLSSLLHEIQHGIQNIEGFASGGNPDALTQKMQTRSYKYVYTMLGVWESVTGDTANFLPSMLADVDPVEFVEDYMRDIGNGVATAEIIKKLKDANYRFNLEAGDDLNSVAEALADDARHDIEEGRVGLSKFEQYKRLAGEVEARNTQTRQKMTDEQRRDQSPESTADVKAEDVIVVFNGKEMLSAPMPANAIKSVAGNITTQAAMSRGKSDQTDTPAFKAWFGDSKVVNKDGTPRVVYRGGPATDWETGAQITEFRSKNGPWAGFFSSEPGVASRFVYGSGVVTPAYIQMTNPLVIDAKGARSRDYQIDASVIGKQDSIVRQQFLDGDYDGLIIKNTSDEGDVFVPRLPTQIKSAIGNNGDFDGTNPDIGFSRSLGATLNDAANNVRSVNLPAGYVLGDFLNGSAPGKLNWWHKTVGTQYNLAQRSKPFKRVYDAVQNFMNDVSYFATEAADLAPSILPKLESWKDITKSPMSPADTQALSAPVFEGTLVWGRDEAGKLVKMETLEAAAAKLTTDQKSQRLLRGNHLTAGVLKMWRGLPIDQYEALIEGKYESDMLKAGVVFTDAELKSQFNLTDAQIGLYREFRAATDKSLTNLSISDMLRFAGKDAEPIREAVLDSKTPKEAADTLAEYLRSQAAEDPERSDVLMDTADKIILKGDKTTDLIDRGYAPLSRFGKYFLDVVDAAGDRVYFGLFESQAEAAKMARKMDGLYPDATIDRGTVSEEKYKLFAGVSPETLELFGDMIGLEAQGDGAANAAFQEYLKLAKSSRSAMKRMIQRKGIAGFSEDAGRVLAGFVYSNARQTASALHMGEMTEAASDKEAFKNEGETQDAAVKLVDYIKNPQEEAQALRGLLFAQYIGGSIASAMVNMTQPLTMTLPWLAQFGGITSAAKQMANGVKDANKKLTGDAKLDAALKRAEEDGTVSPQEVHQLMKQSMGSSALQSGDGTMAGNALAAANNTLSRVMLAWGKPFSLAEQFNRRSTFIAAYRTAVAQKMADPDAFARRAIAETQGVYNKGNKPAWSRGAVGSVIFTFKHYSISYVEMLSRMSKSGPEGKKAALLALGILFLLAGAGGMPGADDLDDIISGAMQSMGYNFDSKSKRQAFFVDLLGQGGAQFMEHGISGLPGVPIDVSGRMGLGNLIPATGLFTKKPDHTRDIAELIGPAGDLIKRGYDASGKILTGNVFGANGAVATIAPKAAQNLAKAYDMQNMGMYRDDKGMKVLDTDGVDAVMKAIGFQPNDVKRSQDANFDVTRMIGLNKMTESEIAGRWALGLFEKDADKVQAARDDLEEWNRANPESPIRINFVQVRNRVKKMNETKSERIAKTAPKEIRNAVREELAAGR